MKINDIILEYNNHLYDEIINSKFFKINILPIIDKPINAIPCLFHGGDIAGNGSIIDVKVRQKPTDTKPIYHNVINHYSNEKFGVPVRNYFFTTQRYRTAENYGKPMMVFPLDDYELYFSDTFEDMFTGLGMEMDDLKSARMNYVTRAMDTPEIKEKLQIVIDELNTKSVRKLGFKEVSQNILDVLKYKSQYDELNYLTTRPFPKTLDELKERYNENAIIQVRDAMVYGALHTTYRTRTFSKNIIEIMTEIADVFTDFMVKSDIKYVHTLSVQYINTISKTKNLSDIEYSHEVMASPGRYAVFEVSTDNLLQHLEDIIRYYNENK